MLKNVSRFDYLYVMTIDELKQALQGKQFTAPVKLEPHAILQDVEQFLRIQFIEVDLWKKDITKCPAYLRLVKFYEVTR
ncbi:DUF6965 family protein [Sphingobacterium chuzhouense]|uniref:DUF6965 domain-containing protein n=2 Tax=Sphingobacterium chuzhouense TaxID=1742264 RepID=A0ABR7XR71_9SPHI|nr:hypothetical protein [Sphingobacterium chuzhouense]